MRKSLAHSTGHPIAKDISPEIKLDNIDTIKTDFINKLKALEPGIYITTIHPIIDTQEIRAIIPGWKNRYKEYLLFMDTDFKEKIIANGIKLVTWNNIK